MVDLFGKNKQQPAQSNGEQKVKFNFKKSNSLANNGDEGNQPPNPSRPKPVTGSVAFNFTKSEPAPTVPVEKNATESDAGSGNKSDLPSTNTTPPSLDSIGEMNIDDFTFKEQPEKYSEDAVEQLNGAIQILHESIDNKQMVGQAISIIMKTLQEHPFLKDNMRARPEDLGLMVEGLRKSYGTVVQRKQGNKKKRVENDKKVMETVEALKGLDLGI